MDVDLEISLDKLPIKRLEALEENGFERFPSDVGYDEKRVNLIRRIDFAWAVEREDPSKKQKSEGASAKEGTSTSQQQWPWQSLVENLQLAHQELSVIIDLINTVEANDAVTVAGMTRPKQLPNEHLSDLAVSTATKLQCFRVSLLLPGIENLGKYFKQSAKSLEEQIAREARFYGALIRYVLNARERPLACAVNLPQKSCHSLQFEVLGLSSASNLGKSSETKTSAGGNDSSKEPGKEYASNDERVREIHLTLREVHRAIHDEQVFDLVNREACNPSLGVNLTGIKENYLRLSIGQGASVSISLLPSSQDDEQMVHHIEPQQKLHVYLQHQLMERKFGGVDKPKKLGIPSPLGFEIYLRQVFHEHVFVKAKNKAMSSSRSQILANHLRTIQTFWVYRTPYVHLVSHPTWHSRTSSWTLSVKIPQSILHAGSQIPMPTAAAVKNIRSQFWTRVLVIDDSIRVEGEGAPNVVGLSEET
ncbi:UNVERIFIED_CONTAM: Mediator of RNA polymerase II transcription subunit [Sesamum calycinum]|uniref:Mediator of RNA polymerase II transcription subunit n=1 Tax=Sesamum calycinum TaxID=2727403 RepID=A0AAW2JM69_9LAMI